MALDGLVLKATIAELQNSLIGAKINKILQPNKSEIIFKDRKSVV